MGLLHFLNAMQDWKFELNDLNFDQNISKVGFVRVRGRLHKYYAYIIISGSFIEKSRLNGLDNI